jgi:RNA recognition motif-containing protein
VSCFAQTASPLFSYGSSGRLNDIGQAGQEGDHMSATLYIDGLLASISEPELKGMFSRFGNVLTVNIVKINIPQSLGIGSVEMETLEVAMKASRALHRSYLGGKLLLVFHGTEATNGHS